MTTYNIAMFVTQLALFGVMFHFVYKTSQVHAQAMVTIMLVQILIEFINLFSVQSK